MANPRVDRKFWAEWKGFEVAHGNEDTFREMLRIQRCGPGLFFGTGRAGQFRGMAGQGTGGGGGGPGMSRSRVHATRRYVSTHARAPHPTAAAKPPPPAVPPPRARRSVAASFSHVHIQSVVDSARLVDAINSGKAAGAAAPSNAMAALEAEAEAGLAQEAAAGECAWGGGRGGGSGGGGRAVGALCAQAVWCWWCGGAGGGARGGAVPAQVLPA